MGQLQKDVLRGWKEIASFVGRDVRTVQRWEQRGLPIRRLPGADRGNVFALASELDAWLHPPLAAHSKVMETISADASEQEVPAALSQSVVAAPTLLRPAPPLHTGWKMSATLAALVGLMAGLWLLLRHHEMGKEVQAQVRPQYVSGVAGVDALYMQGMYEFGKRTPESLLAARKSLAQAVGNDAQDAPAWAGLAETATVLYAYGVDHVPKEQQAVRDYALRALELDKNLAEPHAVIGFSDFFWTHEINAAEPEFLEALRLNPQSALCHNWYGVMLTYEARYPEALRELNEAQRLDPASTSILASRALAFGLSGHRDEALEMLHQAGGDNPIAQVRYNLCVLSLVQPRRMDVYLKEQLALNELARDDDAVRMYTKAQRVYLQDGETAMWRSLLASSRVTTGYIPEMADAYAALGQSDAAFGALQGVNGGFTLPINPLFIPFHHDPRYKQALALAGFPPASE